MSSERVLTIADRWWVVVQRRLRLLEPAPDEYSVHSVYSVHLVYSVYPVLVRLAAMFGEVSHDRWFLGLRCPGSSSMTSGSADGAIGGQVDMTFIPRLGPAHILSASSSLMKLVPIMGPTQILSWLLPSSSSSSPDL